MCVFIMRHIFSYETEERFLGVNYFFYYIESMDERREEGEGRKRGGEGGEPKVENSETFESFCSLVF